MPALDGTGPAGMGPMTGWGRGYCTPYPAAYSLPSQATAWRPAYLAPVYRQGFGLGRGYGRGRGYRAGLAPGFGWGRGYGRGFGFRGVYSSWGRRW